jgi:hypothetical protein
MAKKTKGPMFLRFLAPIVATLKDLGGSASSGDVTDAVIKRLMLSIDEQAEETTTGQSRVRNQIGWARFYLLKDDMIEASQRGIWTLTQKGREAKLDEDGAVLRLFKSVQEQFSKSGVADIVEEERDPDDHEINIFPYDPSKTHIITKTISVEQLAKRLSYEEIDLAPDFQRKANLWTDERKSRLIESMLIRIPLPVFYFDATDDTKWIVVDGLQRLSTIRHFMVVPDEDQRLQLQGLEYLRQHERKTFKSLPRDLQRRIEETQIVAHLIQPGTPIEVKYNIFKRINTGGLVLTPQEIRHALYQKTGGATQLLRELSDSAEFLKATDNGIDKDRGLDCEFVLRFVSFSLTPYAQYTEANMDAFLNRHMKRLNDEGEGPARDDLRRRFHQAMHAAHQIFGKDAFRKQFDANDRRKPINKALFETWSVALGNLDPVSLEKLVSRSDAVKHAIVTILNEDQDFEAAITQATGDVKRVKKRFSTIEDIIRHTLKDAS